MGLKTESAAAFKTKHSNAVLKMVLYAIFTNVYRTGGEGLKHKNKNTKNSPALENIHPPVPQFDHKGQNISKSFDIPLFFLFILDSAIHNRNVNKNEDNGVNKGGKKKNI